MIVDLPHDAQEYMYVADLYKAGLRERYEHSPHYLVDVVRAACGEKADFLMKYMANMLREPRKESLTLPSC